VSLGDIFSIQGKYDAIIFSLVLHDMTVFERFDVLRRSIELLSEDGFIFVIDADSLLDAILFDKLIGQLFLEKIDYRDPEELPGT